MESVPTSEGFWVGSSRADRIWVDLDGDGPISQPVVAGQRVSFVGRLIANHAQLPTQLGLQAPGDVAQLEAQGYHIPSPRTRCGWDARRPPGSLRPTPER